jgi:alpha-galactosidase
MPQASLSNPHYHFTLDLNTGHWNLFSQKRETPYLEGARLGAIYEAPSRRRRKVVYWDGELYQARATSHTQEDPAHGRLNVLRVRAATSALEGARLGVTLEFALPALAPSSGAKPLKEARGPADRPYFLWRAIVHNESRQPLTLDVLDLVRIGPRFRSRSGRSGLLFRLSVLGLESQADKGGQPGALRLHPSPGQLAFFSDGYQSWSFAGALQADRRQPSSIFGSLGDPKVLNLVTPRLRQRGRFTSDMYGALGDRAHDAGLVAGFLSQREQFSHVEVMLDALSPSLRLTAQFDRVSLGPDEARATDWAYLQFIRLGDPDPLGDYVEAAARENDARVPEHTPVGWCSWYHYFDRVAEQDVVANLAAIARGRERLPLDFVQLDDGFQAQVGDWFETKPTFARGLSWLAAEIRARDQIPGLWLAPYMVRSDARLLREHPDWFLRTDDGRRANAGYNWFRWCYGLDPTHPAVRKHVRKLITTAVNDWGFPYLKLDFLYAAALPARRYDPTLTRAQAMRLALSDIRQAAGPDTFLLGCGCPLGSAVGMVDGMRISTDVAPDWSPHLFTPHLAPLLRHEMDYIGVRNAIRNTINRAPLHRRWWLNDPDCLLVRDHDTHLTEAEVRSLATVIALSGGMFLVSDDMSRLGPERTRYIAPLLPVLGASARAPGWMDSEMPDLFTLALTGPAGEWLVTGIFNWADAPRGRTLTARDLGLEAGADYHVSDFWERRQWVLRRGQPLAFAAIPAHGVHLVALRRVTPAPTLVASTFHFSQGGEVRTWAASEKGLHLTLDLGRRDEGELRLALPSAPRTVTVGGQAVAATEVGEGVVSLPFAVNSTAVVEVKW